MKAIVLTFFCSLIFFSCGTNESPSASSQDAAEQMAHKPKVRDTFECDFFGIPNKATAKWLAEKELYFCMSTDEAPPEEMSEFTYNVFQVYETVNCNLIYNGKLPVVPGQKDPYTMHADIYEPVNKLICVQNSEFAHCYHVGYKEALVPLQRKQTRIREPKASADAKRDLHIWQKHLFGWTEGKGAYAFDLRDFRNPGVNMPAAHHSTEEGLNQLFILDTEGGQQALIPKIKDGKIVSIVPLMDKAVPLNKKIIQDRSGGRYAFTQPSSGRDVFVFDLLEEKIVELPSSVKKSTVEIKNYLLSKK